MEEKNCSHGVKVKTHYGHQCPNCGRKFPKETKHEALKKRKK